MAAQGPAAPINGAPGDPHMKGGFGRPLLFQGPRRAGLRGRSKDAPLPHDPNAPSPMAVGLKGCCPRCGQGRLFKGFLSLAPRCESCGLDYAFIDTADGPAFFVMSFVGIVVVGLALWVEFTFEPPIWLHLVMWTVLSIVLSLLLVRPLKGVLMNLQYHHKAEEGRFEK